MFITFQLVGDQHGVRGGDVRVRRVPLHENRAAGHSGEHGQPEGRLIANRTEEEK